MYGEMKRNEMWMKWNSRGATVDAKNVVTYRVESRKKKNRKKRKTAAVNLNFLSRDENSEQASRTLGNRMDSGLISKSKSLRSRDQITWIKSASTGAYLIQYGEHIEP